MKMERRSKTEDSTSPAEEKAPSDGFGNSDVLNGNLAGLEGSPGGVDLSHPSYSANPTRGLHFGAFRPIPLDGERQPGFVANVFNLGREEQRENCHGQVGSSTQSPKDDWAEESEERTTPDDTSRSLRRPKKRQFTDANTPCCPVCSVTVRPSDLHSHFQQEVSRLDQVPKLADRSVNRTSREANVHGARGSTSPSGSRRKEISEKTEARWEVYERTKNNRNNRLTAKANRGQKKSEGTPCPVCNEPLNGTPEELNQHVDSCLRKQQDGSPEDEQVDVEGDDVGEEYDWAGVTRVRATSLLPRGGFSALGFQTHNKKRNEEDEEDLVVDDDDSATFGRAQYGEADVIPCKSDEEDRQRKILRKAVIREALAGTTDVTNLPGPSGTTSLPGTSKWLASGTSSEPIDQQQACSTTTGEQGDLSSQDLKHIISSLKGRISELEDQQNPADRLKCLICMEHYVKPVVSIGCWHVHCEECWLHTLGAKKLCPQCNSITSPTDLRRIFI